VKRIILIMGAAALLMIALLFLMGDESRSVPSVYSSEAGGYMACYRYLRERGHPVEVFRSTPETLDRPALLIMAAPFSTLLSSDHVQCITNFVRKGNTLVFLIDPGGSIWTRHSLYTLADLPVEDVPLPEFENYVRWKTYVLEGEEVRGVRGYLPGDTVIRQQNSRVEFDLKGSFTPVLMGISGTTMGVEKKLGKGKVIFLSNATMLSNYYFRHGGNADFLETLIATHLPEGGTVLFDEYHHGYVAGASPEQYAGGFWFITIHLGVLFLLVVITLRSSFRRPVKPGGLSAYSFDEFIGSLADVHMIARHEGRIRKILTKTLDRLTGEPSGPLVDELEGKSFLTTMQNIPFQEENHGKTSHR